MSKPSKQVKLRLCSGCRDNFYNAGQNGIGVRECWSLKDAEVVTRWKLGWWTSPVEPRAFQEVRTLSCHHEPGKYAFCKDLPSHAVDPVRLGRK